jgi:hypothetical protein
VVNEVGMDGEVVVLRNTQYANPDTENRKDKDKSPKVAKVIASGEPVLTSACTRKTSFPGSFPLIAIAFRGNS